MPKTMRAPTAPVARVVSMMDAMRLAAEAGCDSRTARRWLRGEDVKGEALTLRLQLAASVLKMKRAAS